ncbi:MAG: cyclic nucleotide-binding domain-containing protein [Elusimicrobiota bacterium]
MNVQSVLRGNELFGALSVDEVGRISAFSVAKEFKKGEMIFACDHPGTHFFMLMDGLVYLQLPANPPEFSFAISRIQEGELFGLSPLLDSPQYTCMARCSVDTKVLSIEAGPFRELLRENAQTGFAIMNRVARIYFNRYIEILKKLDDVVGQISLIR